MIDSLSGRRKTLIGSPTVDVAAAAVTVTGTDLNHQPWDAVCRYTLSVCAPVIPDRALDCTTALKPELPYAPPSASAMSGRLKPTVPSASFLPLPPSLVPVQ